MKKLVKLLAVVGCIVAGHANAEAKWTGAKTVTSVQIVNTRSLS